MAAALFDSFERSRERALGAGVALGLLGAAGGALVRSFEAGLFLAVGLAGSTYYLLHYRSVLANFDTDSLSRGFVRNFAMILPVALFIDESAGLARGLALAVGIASLFVLFAASFAVEADPAAPADDGRGGDADDRPVADSKAHESG
jgi:hypothetical protein